MILFTSNYYSEAYIFCVYGQSCRATTYTADERACSSTERCTHGTDDVERTPRDHAMPRYASIPDIPPRQPCHSTPMLPPTGTMILLSLSTCPPESRFSNRI